MPEEETLISYSASQFLRNTLVSLVATVNHKWKLSTWASYHSEELKRMSHWGKSEPGVQQLGESAGIAGRDQLFQRFQQVK